MVVDYDFLLLLGVLVHGIGYPRRFRVREMFLGTSKHVTSRVVTSLRGSELAILHMDESHSGESLQSVLQ